MRLIDADELPVRSIDETDLPKDKGLLVVLKEDIDNAPTVEYPFYQEAYQTGYEEGKNERPQGEWITVPKYDFYDKCSICGKFNLWKRTNFCPNCGVKMKI